ncbi:GNAT family N-acetyltransferase [Pedobacter namyangjuensis]|uniref:GNAT family N-acetyltransferase n=1 Tax=Pedobacter namyangjuensis TaxID=600626 RepID=UPI000DE1C810|nr:GNAT family N-acetyltransferase [Pedobacter namyangjuensis]
MKTERLLLRSIIPSDITNIFNGLSDPDVVKYYGVSYATLKKTEEQMLWFSELEKNKTGKWWAIADSSNTAFYGGIGINNLDILHRKAEIGFWLLPAYWGKAFIIEAAHQVLKYCFETLNLHRVEALVETENANSKSVLKKLGFEYEGTMKDCEVKNGKFISIAIFAKFNK